MHSTGLLPYDRGQPSPPLASQRALALENTADTAQAKGTGPVAESLTRILVVEDDVPLARLLSSWLKTEDFEVDLAHDGEEAAGLLASHPYSLVLLDLNLPKIDGLTLLSRMHAEQPAMAVLVLTGRNRPEDTVLALNQGADDCLIKPFSLLELIARIRALLRRRISGPIQIVPAPRQGLLLNREEYRVERDGRTIDLTRREFALLAFLMEQSPHPVSRATLMEQVWRVPFDPSTNIVDVYMKYLRDKIDCGDAPKLIRTVRGVGYALACA